MKFLLRYNKKIVTLLGENELLVGGILIGGIFSGGRRGGGANFWLVGWTLPSSPISENPELHALLLHITNRISKGGYY